MSDRLSTANRLIGRGRPRSGLSEEARQLGVSRQVLYRVRKMTGLSPEAKDEAIRRGLAAATTTLLRAAEQGDPAEQVRVTSVGCALPVLSWGPGSRQANDPHRHHGLPPQAAIEEAEGSRARGAGDRAEAEQGQRSRAAT